MAGCASGQDEANPVFWLATREGKTGLSCPLGIARFVLAKAKFFGVIFWLYNKPFINQAWGQDGWTLASFLFAFTWTSTSPMSIKNVKKNLANIQPSWSHAWSITHIYVWHKTFDTSTLQSQDFSFFPYFSFLYHFWLARKRELSNINHGHYQTITKQCRCVPFLWEETAFII